MTSGFLLAKLCQSLACFILYSKAEFVCYSTYLLTSYFCIPVPYNEKDIIFIIGDWNAKVGSQEIPGVTRKIDFVVQSEAEQRRTEFCQENTLVIANNLFQQTREDSTQGHHQMVNTEIRLIISFVAKDGEALYSQQKQDQELTVAQIMNFLLTNSDLN